jgi:hypothetical protein
MRPLSALLALAASGTIATVARGGHELPVYPSYYPHEIAIETVAPERSVGLLRESQIHAYLGDALQISSDLPKSIRSIESLGSFVTVRINSGSPLATHEASACAAIETVVRDIAGKDPVVFHPYPVTPFHGDYIYHVDLADAAKARFLPTSAENSLSRIVNLRVKASAGLVNLVRSAWRTEGTEWDVAIDEISATDLMASARTSVNGWLGPPWVKSGWFHAARILADAVEDADRKQLVEAALRRLEAGDYSDAVEQGTLQRDLVTALTRNCRKVVVGYTVKRQYFSAEFTDGIENIGFDSIDGLNSPMFIRTVKLKNFPWNGWLVLGIDSAPDAAWNPIAGFSDRFGRLLWSAVGDPALLYAPYDSGWMINRFSDVRSNAARSRGGR